MVEEEEGGCGEISRDEEKEEEEEEKDYGTTGCGINIIIDLLFVATTTNVYWPLTTVPLKPVYFHGARAYGLLERKQQ